MKYCPDCNTDKNEDEFPKNKCGVGGVGAYCKLCHAARSRVWRSNNRQKHRDMANNHAKTPRGRFGTGKRLAKFYGREWTIPFEQYEQLILLPCHYCGESLNKTGYGLDRQDTSGGYTLDNVVQCCHRCNTMKGYHLTYEEMKWIWNSRLQKAA